MADRYKIYERLGEGGVGAVFRAYDTQLKRWVAIKRLFAEADDDPDEIRREADALASLRNPNIVTIFDVARDNEGLFIVMELLEGDDLSNVIEEGPLSFDDFKELANQMLEGLISAHQLHILHRDIKPENIKIERLPGGRLQSKIIDFGLARAGLKARKQTESHKGTVMGSIFYMAPEQLTRRPVDERSDLYALGCVFYEALSGQKAFTGPTMSEVVDKHVAHEFRPLNEVAVHVPLGLVNWVHRLMAKSPDERPASAQQAIEEFRTWEKSPAAMPFGGWTAPLVPTSDVVSPEAATGNATQALAALTQSHRPVHRSATRSSPAQARPAPPASAVRSSAMKKPAPKRARPNRTASGESSGDNPLKAIGLVGGGILAAVLVLWMMFKGGNEATSSSPSSAKAHAKKASPPSPSPKSAALAKTSPSAYTPTVLPGDIVAHFVAEERVFTTGGKVAQVGDPVLKWRDGASLGGDNTLNALNDKQDHAPVLADWSGVPNIKPGLKVVDFRAPNGLLKQLAHSPGAPQQKDFPKRLANRSGRPGVTLAVVFQASGGKPPQRALFMGGPNGQSALIRIDNKNNILGVAKVGKNDATITGPGVKGGPPTVAILSWAASGEVQLRASDANGKRFEKSAGKRGMPQPLYRMEMGKAFTAAGKPAGPWDQFRGRIAEAIVYSSALSKEQMTQLERELRTRYFVNP
jgi:serine/threonine protein kinase